MSYIKLHNWHKRFGLTLAIFVIAWGLSGIAHPIMSRIKPMAATKAVIHPIDFSAINSALNLSIETRDISNIILLSGSDKKPLLSIKRFADNKKREAGSVGSEWEYYDLTTGEQLNDYPASELPAIAKKYSGIHDANVASVTLVDQFSFDYPKVNRHLPAFKVQFEDDAKTQVYFDVQTLEAVSISNKYKSAFSEWFSYLHSWSFIENKTIRYALMLILLTIFFLSALMGTWLAIQKMKKKSLLKGNKTRKAHRITGLIVSLAALAFSFSGAYHAVIKLLPKESYNSNVTSEVEDGFSSFNFKERLDSSFINRYTDKSVARIQWSPINGDFIEQAFILKKSRFGTKVSDVAYRTKSDENSLIANEVQSRLKKNIDSYSLQKNFNQEYGFIDKRLPIYRVQSGSDIYFFEPNSAKIVKHMNTVKTLESYSFSFLHKGRFMDALGKDIRDIIIVLFVFGTVLLTFFGLKISLSTRKSRR